MVLTIDRRSPTAIDAKSEKDADGTPPNANDVPEPSEPSGIRSRRAYATAKLVIEIDPSAHPPVTILAAPPDATATPAT